MFSRAKGWFQLNCFMARAETRIIISKFGTATTCDIPRNLASHIVTSVRIMRTVSKSKTVRVFIKHGDSHTFSSFSSHFATYFYLLAFFLKRESLVNVGHRRPHTHKVPSRAFALVSREPYPFVSFLSTSVVFPIASNLPPTFALYP